MHPVGHIITKRGIMGLFPAAMASGDRPLNTVKKEVLYHEDDLSAQGKAEEEGSWLP